MEQLLSWGWDGVIIVVVVLLLLRAIPVAFDAWKTGNLIVGAVKTVGPVVSLAALLYGGWWVIRDAGTFIYNDAQQSQVVQDARNWTGSGASALTSGSADAASGLAGYVESFRQEWQSAAPQAQPVTEQAAEQPQAQSGIEALVTIVSQPAQPTAAPTRAAGVWSAPVQTNQGWGNTPVMGPQPRPTQGPAPRPTQAPAPTQGPAPAPGWNVTFGNGGGPQAAEADRAVAGAVGGTYTVQPGDSLWKISEAFYGNRHGGQIICQANRDVIRNCDALRAGMELTIPAINQ